MDEEMRAASNGASLSLGHAVPAIARSVRLMSSLSL
jgi:hypothetical protein